MSEKLRALFRGVRLRVLAVKALDAAGRIYQLLFAGEERVAIRADFQPDVALVGGTGSEHVAARAMHAHFVIRGVNSCLHVALDLSCESLILQELRCFRQYGRRPPSMTEPAITRGLQLRNRS